MKGNYFGQVDYISNSEFSRLMKRAGYGFEDPPNLDKIFEFGILFEDLLLQPLKVDVGSVDANDYKLACEMVETARQDVIIRQLLSVPDFRVQHEYYRNDVFGFKGRCKTDGDSRMLKMMLELKGLSVATDNAFREAVDRFDYDRAAAWYINTTQRDRSLITCVSKKAPKRIFKFMVTKGDAMYNRGVEKIDKVKKVINQLVGDLGLEEALKEAA